MYLSLQVIFLKCTQWNQKCGTGNALSGTGNALSGTGRRSF